MDKASKPEELEIQSHMELKRFDFVISDQLLCSSTPAKYFVLNVEIYFPQSTSFTSTTDLL